MHFHGNWNFSTKICQIGITKHNLVLITAISWRQLMHSLDERVGNMDKWVRVRDSFTHRTWLATFFKQIKRIFTYASVSNWYCTKLGYSRTILFCVRMSSHENSFLLHLVLVQNKLVKFRRIFFSNLREKCRFLRAILGWQPIFLNKIARLVLKGNAPHITGQIVGDAINLVFSPYKLQYSMHFLQKMAGRDFSCIFWIGIQPFLSSMATNEFKTNTHQNSTIEFLMTAPNISPVH